jgi:hypothetical protein
MDDPVTPVALSAQQWRAIADVVGLPDEAQRPLESRMTLYRHFCKQRQTVKPSETRQKLQGLRDLAVSLLAKLSDVDSEMLMALINCAPNDRRTPKHDALMLLDKRRSEIAELANWCKIAAGEIKPQKRGPDGENLVWLVEQCDLILQHYIRRTIARTNYKNDKYEKFITLVADAAAAAAGHRSVGGGSIDRAMKTVISRRGTDGPENLAITIPP